MRQTGKRGSSTRIGTRGAILIMIALLGMMLAPPLAAAIVGPIKAPAALAPVNTAAPTLTGTPALGQTLTCTTGTWANAPTSFSYTWLRSGVPIAGQAGSTYVVQAADQGHTVSCQVTAGNGGGDYTISGLASGSYKVDFFAEQEGLNYLTQYFSGKTAYKEANLVSVTVPGATGGVNAAMAAGGQISGRVTSAATHAAIADVEVCADETGGGPYGGCAPVNGNGEYTISGLNSGSYDVEFYPFLEEGNYLPQYYIGKASVTEASSVAVTAGSTSSNINAELQPGGEVSGRVTDTSSHPLEKIEVCARETTDDLYAGCAVTNSNGEYTVASLPSSSYTVEFSPIAEGANYALQFWHDKASFAEAESVVVSAPDTTPNIDAEMHPGGQISGTVTDASSHARLAKIEVCADEGTNEYSARCASTNGNGEYTIAGLPAGSYKVEFFGGYEGGDYLTQYWSDKASFAEAEAVAVTLGKTQEGINAEMRSGGGIAGRVTDATTHAPIEKAEVCAVESGGNRVGGCTSTNASGAYAIFQLESGSYTIEVSDYQEGSNYLPQAVSGVSVTVPGTTSPVNAELHPGGQISGVVTDAVTRTGIVGIEVCAVPIAEGSFEHCASTASGAASASATSNALAIPGGSFVLKKVSFDSKSNDLDFFFTFPTAGKLTWGLFFRNADVGFADSLGLSLQANGVAADAASAPAIAEAARKHKSKGCKKGTIKHHGKCVHVLVPFGVGSQSVATGSVEVKVHAGSKAIKALKAGRTLHVSGTFIFQSVFGGPAVAKQESTVVRLPKKHSKGHGKGKKH
jgi:hypothetical protein